MPVVLVPVEEMPAVLVPVGECRSSLCRSGVEPPTGIVADRQKQILTDDPNRYLIISIPQPAKGERSVLVPVGGCTPDRNDPPTQEHWRGEGNGKGWAREGGTNSEV